MEAADNGPKPRSVRGIDRAPDEFRHRKTCPNRFVKQQFVLPVRERDVRAAAHWRCIDNASLSQQMPFVTTA